MARLLFAKRPAMLGEVDAAGLVKALCDDIANFGDAHLLKERLEEVCSSMACHGSIRAGRCAQCTGDECVVCERWKQRRIQASATMADQLMWS